MPIATAKAFGETLRRNGGTYVFIVLTDTEGKQHQFKQNIPPGVSIEDRLVKVTAEYNISLARNEERQAIQRIKDGESALSVIQTQIHATKKDTVTQVLRYMMKNGDVDYAIAIAPLVEKLKIDYTGVELRALLGVTSEQLTRLNAKVAAATDAKTGVDALKSIEEDWS